MVDLGGYVIILVETQDKRVKLYGKFDMQWNMAEWLNFVYYSAIPIYKIYFTLDLSIVLRLIQNSSCSDFVISFFFCIPVTIRQ